MIGNIAYVADRYDGLQIIDVSNPVSPTLIGSVDTPGDAREVTVIGNIAYVADWGGGLQIIDVSNSASPTLIGSVDTPGQACAVTVIGDTAYVADGGSGLVIVPLPVEIKPVIVNSDTSISVILPSPQIAGHYNLRVFNENESYELYGAVNLFGKCANVKSHHRSRRRALSREHALGCHTDVRQLRIQGASLPGI